MVIESRSGMRIFVGADIAVLALLLTAPVGRLHHKGGYLREFDRPGSAKATIDVVGNVVAFVPLGWGLTHVVRRRSSWAASFTLVILMAAAFSVSVETVQYFQHMRYSSIVDVACNTLGALVGAGIAGVQALLISLSKRTGRVGSAVR